MLVFAMQFSKVMRFWRGSRAGTRNMKTATRFTDESSGRSFGGILPQNGIENAYASAVFDGSSIEPSETN